MAASTASKQPPQPPSLVTETYQRSSMSDHQSRGRDDSFCLVEADTGDGLLEEAAAGAYHRQDSNDSIDPMEDLLELNSSLVASDDSSVPLEAGAVSTRRYWEAKLDSLRGSVMSKLASPAQKKTKGRNERVTVGEQLDTTDSPCSSSGGPSNLTSSWHQDKERVKGKLRVAWNNVKYGWTWNVNEDDFNDDSPIWLLGKFYHTKRKSRDTTRWYDVAPGYTDNFELENEPNFTDFIGDFASRLWFTYRSGFPSLLKQDEERIALRFGNDPELMSSDAEGVTADSRQEAMRTDCGWGCMLRSGQMLLAQGLLVHLLGREWNVLAPQTPEEKQLHRSILRYFGDGPAYPLSIHRMVEWGGAYQEKALGEWYGPASTANLCRDLLSSRRCLCDPVLGRVALCVARDCTVCLQEVEDLCTMPVGDRVSADDVWTKALVLIVPLRLGVERINPIYFSYVKTLLSLRHCLGIMGGKPKHSMFFVGWHGNHLLYLDPHYCQSCVDVDVDNFPIKSYHCHYPKKLAFKDMDPSCAVGFYCRDREGLYGLLEGLQPIADMHCDLMTSKARGGHPLFSVVQCRERDTTTAAGDVRPPTSPGSERATAHQHGFELL